MRAAESVQFANQAAGNLGPFTLYGGYYQVALAATGSGTAQLETLGPDGATWLNVGSDLTANGVAYFYCAPGEYRLTVATFTAVYASITRVPTE